MSDAFYEYLSDDVRALCRLCDKCTGSFVCVVLLLFVIFYCLCFLCSQGICGSNVLLHI